MVAIGVQAFHERPTRRQWAAVGLATCGVVVVTIAHGSPPWIALVLALTFAFYGWVKKQLGVAAVDGMTIETGVMFAPALVYIVYTQVHGTATFGHESPSHSILMIGASLVMFLPMLLFSAASRLIPLSTLGLMQYIEPGVQFLLGILAFHEAIPTSTWVAFVFIWAAVAALIYDALRTAKRALDAREAEGQVGISFTE
jgi:chloramphenicol-sensitive protein RarD